MNNPPPSTAARILLLGAGGQLGRDLRRALMPVGEVLACVRGPSADASLSVLDIADTARLDAFVDDYRPQWIVNAAAYTAVDAAEQDIADATRVNADAVEHLAAVARRNNAVLLHYSTDYVFSGDAQRPWREDDPTEPVNAYGRSKLDGEQRIAASGCDYLVLRTGWLYATHGSNFLLTMLRLRETHPQLRVVDDQIGAPTWTRPLADLSAALIAQTHAAGREWLRQRSGVYHAGAAGQCTWHGFTRRILERAGESPDADRLVPVTTSEFPRPARRPVYSVLDGTRLASSFALRLPDWRVQLDAAMVDLGFAPPANGDPH